MRQQDQTVVRLGAEQRKQYAVAVGVQPAAGGLGEREIQTLAQTAHRRGEQAVTAVRRGLRQAHQHVGLGVWRIEQQIDAQGHQALFLNSAAFVTQPRPAVFLHHAHGRVASL